MPSIHPTDDPLLGIASGLNNQSEIRLLVVEDNADDQELLRFQLRKAKIKDQILFVSSAAKAIDILVKDELKIRSKLFAIFLDLKLNGESGLEVLRVIRSVPETASIPVIVMTGTDNPEEIQECQRLKATSYLKKPANYQTFCMSVANVFHLPHPTHSVSDTTRFL